MEVAPRSLRRARDSAVALAAAGVSKAYAGTPALIAADLEVSRGEIRALCGGNGSGKSTLIKILAGVETADAGLITADEVSKPAHTWSPTDAAAAELHFVHQAGGVFQDLNIAENLSLGRGFERSRAGSINRRAMFRRSAEILDRFHIEAAPNTPLRNLGRAEQTMVAIARALQDQEGAERGVLLLDEPTAALPAAEVDLLLNAIRRYAEAGQTIVFVSHRVDEVLELAHSATVLRDGRVVADRSSAELDRDLLCELIAGRSVTAVSRPDAADKTAVALSVSGLSGTKLRDVDLDIREKEIMGVAGLVGSGRTELLRLMYGAERPTEGPVLIGGHPTEFRHPADAMRAGVAYVPGDRAGAAAFLDLSVRENLSIAWLKRLWRQMHFDRKAERTAVGNAISSCGIKASTPSAPLSTLSGGNQQKVVLGRWLGRQPKVLLLDEPTQGVDVGARAEIHGLISRAVNKGACALIVSSDLEELLILCDRICVLVDGRLTAVEATSSLNEEELTRAAYEVQA